MILKISLYILDHYFWLFLSQINLEFVEFEVIIGIWGILRKISCYFKIDFISWNTKWWILWIFILINRWMNVFFRKKYWYSWICKIIPFPRRLLSGKFLPRFYRKCFTIFFATIASRKQSFPFRIYLVTVNESAISLRLFNGY